MIYWTEIIPPDPASPVTRDNLFRPALQRLGYQVHSIEKKDVFKKLAEKDSIIILFEWYIPFVLENAREIFDLCKQNGSRFLLAIERCEYLEPYLDRLNNTKSKNNAKEFFGLMFSTQFNEEYYSDFNCFEVDSVESWFQHDFVKHLFAKWQTRPKLPPTYDYLYLAGGRKDSFRKKFLDGLFQSKLKIHIEYKNNVDSLYTKTKKFDDWMTSTFNVNLLGGFGNGIPKLDLYEKCKIELVVETYQNDNWCQITEKIWRPLLAGMPFVALCSKATYKKIINMGYRMEPTSFYQNYFNLTQMNDRINYALDFFKEFKVKENLKHLQDCSLYNKKHFWGQRKDMYWSERIESCKSFFGYCPLEEVEKKLLEI